MNIDSFRCMIQHGASRLHYWQCVNERMEIDMRRMMMLLAALVVSGVVFLDPAAGVQQKAAVIPPAAPAPVPAARGRGPGVPATTLDQFQKSVQIAKLAAENDMHALSLRAVREALRGGTPIQVMPEDGRMYGRYVRYPGGVAMMEGGENTEVAQQVEDRLLDLDQVWTRRKFPADQVYETLVQVMIPESRPAEIFLYQRPLAWGVQQPRSLGKLLTQWTVKAGKQDDLKKRVAARQALPLAELPGRVLLVQLGLAGKDPKLTIETLDWFAERMKKDTLQNTAEMACHAALPALRVPDTSAAALPVIELAVKNLSGQNQEEPTGMLRLALARFHFEKKNTDAGKKQLQEFLKDAERFYVNYGGDYTLYRRKEQLGRVAAEYARAGHTQETLELLGQWADAPRYRGGEPPISHVVNAVSRQLAARPAAERYETLKTFALPAANRKSVRLLAAFAPFDDAPAAFAALSTLHQETPTPRGESSNLAGSTAEARRLASGRAGERETSFVVGNATLLIDAAREVNKLDELAGELKTLADQKIENADTFYSLVQIARGEGASVEPQLKAILEERKKSESKPQVPNRYGYRDPISWSDYLTARACLTDPKLRELGEGLCRHLLLNTQRVQEHGFMSHLRQDLAKSLAAREGGVATRPGQDSGLALWRPATLRSAWSLQGPAVPAWWIEHEGHISQISGPESNWLYFNYPLSGTFEFSVDCYSYGWAEGNVGYGGLAFEALHLGQGGSVWPIGGMDRLQRPYRCVREGFNRIMVQSQPGKLRVLLNNHLFYETDKPSPTSPWLALYSSRERQTYFRNLTLKGKPEIPREIKLIVDDRMEGWATSFYNETRPPRLTAGQTQPDLYDQYGRAVVADATLGVDAYDWGAKEGVLHGRRGGGQYQNNPQMDLTQSRIYYHRPLSTGDEVRYEFLYEPGIHHVHPALGRLAFLLEAEGVKAHWMTGQADNDWSGLKPDNAIVEPNCRRGPAPLPLKPGEWNAVRMTLKDNQAAIELNGTLIYERKLEPAIEPQFGLFHYKDQTAVQVRNVILRGNWPESLSAEQLANLLKRSSKDAPAELHARSAIIGEPIFYQSAYRTLEKARDLPVAERFAFLSEWVLPGPEHKAWRLYAEFTPTDAAPGPKLPVSPLGGTPEGVRVQTGGELVAPVLELIAVAKELGKLDELLERVQKAAGGGLYEERCKLAMAALIRTAQQKDGEAAEALRGLLPLLGKLPEETPEHERWAEIVAAAAAMTHPTLHPHGMALLDHVVVNQMQKPDAKIPARPAWGPLVRHLRARGQVLALEPRVAFGTPPKLASWSPVTHPTAERRGRGDPAAHWAVNKGEIKHYPGHAHDYMYLNVPLRGNFEINCELTGFGWREAQLTYGGIRVFLVHDLKRINLEHYNRPIRTIPLDPPMEKLGDWYPYRLVVQDGMYTAYINDRKVFEERLPADPDPWLAVHALNYLTGGARNLRITGNPTVPDEIHLSAGSDLSGWLGAYYGEGVTGQNAAWEKRGDEIFGRSVVVANQPNAPDQKNTKQESLIQYHRPMLEDGEIEYEFFHEPNKTMVHPALDRLTFLLEADGVKIHWLTDAQHDRTGLSPDNVIVEAANRRGPDRLPLKADGWNRLKLGVTGNKIALRLNDTLVYERELEPANLRIFGLFHYADESDVRVRNVKYRGQWPKKLPAAEELLSVRPAKTRSRAGE